MQKLICGPEARAAHAKSIGGDGISCGALGVVPQDGAGLKGARRAPLQGVGPILAGRMTCPPVSGTDECLMIFCPRRPGFRARHDLKFILSCPYLA